MIIACPRCEASYAVDAAVFGSRNRVVQCSACDYRWSQPPHEAGEVHAGDESALVSPDAGIGDAPDRQQPINAAEPVELEAPELEPAVPMVDEQSSSAPAPALGVTAADTPDILDGQVRYTLQERPSPPPPQSAEKLEVANGPTAAMPLAHQPDHRSGRAPVVAGMAALGTIISLVAVLILFRDLIVSALPDAVGLYGLIGLAPDPLGHGLEIREVTSTRERVGNEDVLSVTGIVANVSRERQLLPPLRVSLYDAADEELQFMRVPHAQEGLDAGETVRFQATIPSSRAEARRLRVGFIAP